MKIITEYVDGPLSNENNVSMNIRFFFHMENIFIFPFFSPRIDYGHLTTKKVFFSVKSGLKKKKAYPTLSRIYNKLRWKLKYTVAFECSAEEQGDLCLIIWALRCLLKMRNKSHIEPRYPHRFVMLFRVYVIPKK